jgi:transcriptional regulator with XRE-family HTH domain
MNISEKLGNKLRMLREVHNYTQEYVAGVIDVAPNTYSLLEKGQATFSIERIEKLAQLYKMEMSDFLRLSDQTIIHHITHSNGICSENVNIHHNGLADEERRMYKDAILRLEEQNNKLMILVEKLSNKLN